MISACLFRCLALAAVAVAAAATAWAELLSLPPQPLRCRSDNGAWELTIEPAAGRTPCCATLSTVPAGAAVWSATLANPTAPLESFVSDDGRFVVTRDDYDAPGLAYSVAIYDVSDATRTSFAGPDLIEEASPERRAWWGLGSEAWFSPDGGHFVLRTEHHGDLVFDLAARAPVRDASRAAPVVRAAREAIEAARQPLYDKLSGLAYRSFHRLGSRVRGTVQRLADYSVSTVAPGQTFEGCIVQSVWPVYVRFRDGTRGYNLMLQLADNANSGFEEPGGWTVQHWDGRGLAERDTTVAHEGSASFRFEAKAGYAGSVNQKVRVQPQTRYVLSAQIKTEELKPVTPGASGASIGVKERMPVFPNGLQGTRDWTRIEYEFDTGDDDEIEIQCIYGGLGMMRGKAWFDDVRVQPK